MNPSYFVTLKNKRFPIYELGIVDAENNPIVVGTEDLNEEIDLIINSEMYEGTTTYRKAVAIDERLYCYMDSESLKLSVEKVRAVFYRYFD